MKTVYLSESVVVYLPDMTGQEITVNGRVWRFDFCRYAGPLWLKANGKSRKCQNPKKAVWAEFEKWHKKHTEVQP